MSAHEFRDGLIDYIRQQANPRDKFSHQTRLCQLARVLAEEQPFDDDILFAAVWMHDLGVFIGHRPEEPAALARWDNVDYAMEKTPSILREMGFPFEKIAAVVEVIRTHLPSATPTSFEGTLMRDADILEQLGAVGILRTVSKVGRDTRFIYFKDALKALQKSAATLPSLLILDSAKTQLKPRLALLNAFLEAAEAENAS